MERVLLLFEMARCESLRLSALSEASLRAEAESRGFASRGLDRQVIERAMLGESSDLWLETDYRRLREIYDQIRP